MYLSHGPRWFYDDMVLSGTTGAARSTAIGDFTVA